MNVLVTGGAGYIGSHAVLRLLGDGHEVTVLDNMVRGNHGALDTLRGLGSVRFLEADVGDRDRIEPALADSSIDVVMHFAALTYVGESVEQPLRYYRSNLAGAITLLEAAVEAGVDRFIFSSTAATYGEPPPTDIPITEECPQRPINPYGRSKLAVERVLRDHLTAAPETFSFAALRYFNVAGCDPEGRLGEDHDPETHLIPICLQVALGQRAGLTIFGEDYPTPDGTCVRDYVHVCDLVDAHVAVMNRLQPGVGVAYNVGIGRGHSVREVVDSVRRVTGHPIPATEGPRRSGDPPVLYADPSKIERALGWRAKWRDLDGIVETAWRWFETHPDGYRVCEKRP